MKDKKDKMSWRLHIKTTRDQFTTEELKLGPWTSDSLIHDPKHMCFVLSRYKFCAKILHGKNRVLEIGCGDGFGIPIMAQSVNNLHCIDWEERNIEGNPRRLHFLKNVTYECLDITTRIPKDLFDAAFSIDVIEHIEPDTEDYLLSNICKVLVPNGMLIIGTPNKTASMYATERSDSQHINLKSTETLKNLMEKYFENCLIFSMNDEVIHTGYYPMAHYLFALGIGKINR